MSDTFSKLNGGKMLQSHIYREFKGTKSIEISATTYENCFLTKNLRKERFCDERVKICVSSGDDTSFEVTQFRFSEV
jgi:hypothetical protein